MKSSVSSDTYLDMSPQYHSASCNEPLAASFTPLPFTGVMGFVGLGGRAAKEIRFILVEKSSDLINQALR